MFEVTLQLALKHPGSKLGRRSYYELYTVVAAQGFSIDAALVTELDGTLTLKE